MKRLIVAAHPDDEVLGCGGVIAKYGAVDDFYVLILTGGAESRYDKSFEKTLRAHSSEANTILGTREVFFEDLPNQGLDNIPLTTVIQTIEKYIDMVSPDTLFIHSGSDLNKDHRIVFEAGTTAARTCVGQRIKRLYAYFVASSSEWNPVGECFAANTYIDITKSLPQKIEAMKCYTSECRPYPHPRSPEAVELYARYWGVKVGFNAVEPFQLIHDISGDFF